MAMDSRRQASEAIKDLMVNEKRSRLPLVLGVLAALLVSAAAGYWFTLPPDKRPDLDQLKNKAIAFSKSILNTPISSSPSASTAPASSDAKNGKPGSSSDDVHLLSN